MRRAVSVMVGAVVVGLLMHCGDDSGDRGGSSSSSNDEDRLEEGCRALCCEGVSAAADCVTACVADAGACRESLLDLGQCADGETCCAVPSECRSRLQTARDCVNAAPPGTGGGSTTSGVGGGACDLGTEIKVLCNNGLDDDCDQLTDCDDPDCMQWPICGGSGGGGGATGGGGAGGGASLGDECLGAATLMSMQLFDARFSTAAITSAGELILTGSNSEVIDFGGGPLDAGGNQAIFVVKLDAAGNHLWSKQFNGNGADGNPTAVAVDDAGAILLTGHIRGAIDFGGGPLGTVLGPDIESFVLKLDADGNHVMAHRYGQSVGGGIVAGPNNEIIVVGSFSGTVVFGGEPLTSAGGDDVFLLRLDASGAHLRSQRFGSTEDDDGNAVATDASGAVYIGGGINNIDFDDEEVSPRPAFVAKIDNSGVLLWANPDGTGVEGLALASDGALYAASVNRLFKLDAATGETVFELDVDAWPSVSSPLVADAAGSVWMLGDTNANCALPDDSYVFMTRVDTAICGNIATTTIFSHPDNGEPTFRTLLLDPNGNVVVVGRVGVDYDFGNGPTIATGGFVARFQP